MIWAYVLLAVGLSCGMALSLFLNVEIWKQTVQTWRELRQQPRDEFRRNLRAGLGTLGGCLVAAVVVFAIYKIGSSRCGSRTGAALAIGASILVMIGFYGLVTALVIRESRRDKRESTDTEDH